MNNEERILHQKQSERVRPVGRPAVNPFRNRLVEEDFYRRAAEVVRQAYDHSPENTKKPFVLSSNCRMGKTAFWAFIYYYYTNPDPAPVEFATCGIFPMEPRPLIDENLDYFIYLLKARLGEEVVGTRPAILKRVQAYRKHKLTVPYLTALDNPLYCDYVKLATYRKQYEFVLKVWKGIVRG